MDSILKKRKINYLVHFTRVENLKNILNRGLIPREYIDNRMISGLYNDEYRYDKCRDYNSMSIEFPNYKMFFRLRKEDERAEWVVLLFDIEIIKNFECLFCYSNAGSKEMYSLSKQIRKGKKAFEGMFDDRDNYPKRCVTKIPERYPTNPQAEVLVKGIIPPKYIRGVIFENFKTANKHLGKIPGNIEIFQGREYFAPRCDFKEWPKN